LLPSCCLPGVDVNARLADGVATKRRDLIMLILSRKVGESLVIGDDIVVTVLSIRKHQIRFGISAPSDVSVHREEVYERIAAEQTRQSPAAPQSDKVKYKVRLSQEAIGQRT